MTTMASQITSLTVVYSAVYSDADQRKHQSSASLAFVWGIHRTGEFPAQRASYAENVSIWWRHHAHNARKRGGSIFGNGWNLKYPISMSRGIDEIWSHADRLVHDFSIFIADALAILQSCTVINMTVCTTVCLIQL